MDLAKLVVKLEAQSAQFLAELQKSNRQLDKFEKSATASLDKVNRKFEKFGFGVKSILGGLVAGVSFGKVISATEEAAATFAQLENAVENAGAAAGGRTAKQFAEAAREIAGITTETGGAVQGVQQLLLRFQNIRTDKFDAATMSVLNFAAATKRDLTSAAELVGKALSNPEKGMTALAKAGVAFSDQQQKVIKSLVETGRRAEAQGLILDALEKRYGGAAEAARGNFAGALKAVRNSLGDLLEADGGLPQATESLNELTKTLQDPAVRAGADALFSVIIRGAAAAAQFIGETVAGLAILLGYGQNEAVNLDRQIDQLQDQLNHLQKSNPFPDAWAKGEMDRLIKQIGALTTEYEKLMGLGAAGATKIGTPVKKDDAGAIELPDIEVIDGLTDAAEKLQEKLEAAGKAMTESVATPMETMQKRIAEADRLLAAQVITFETWQRAVSAAADAVDPFLGAISRMSEEAPDLTDAVEQAAKDIDEDVAASTDKNIDAERESAEAEFDKVLDKSADKFDVFAEEASRNVQDILGEGINNAMEDGFEDGAKGALEAFTNMIQRMIAEALAADIAGKLFGEDGVNSGGGWLGKIGGLFGGKSGPASAPGGSSGGGFGGGGILNLLGSFFGGSMDKGGPGKAGVAYAIGRGAQPEVFVPEEDGHFFPNGTGTGGGRVTQNIYTTGQISERSARQLEVEASRRQRIATARLG